MAAQEAKAAGDGADKTPVAGPMGPEMAKFAERAPAVMAELMQQFIEKKSLVERAKIRLQVKALQDFFSADTKYPPVPAISADQLARKRGLHAGAAAGVGQYVGFGDGHVGRRAAGEVEELQRAVEDAVRQEEAARPAEALAVPAAPGAAVAPAAEPLVADIAG